MRKAKFNEIKKNNPESRIWKRTWGYQQSRDDLAKALKSWDEKNEKSARMNYLVEKAFSKESFSKQDYDFILWLSKKDLDRFISLVTNGVFDYIDAIITDNEIYEREPSVSAEEAYFWWNKILRFIWQTRNDVLSEMKPIYRYHTRINPEINIESRTDEIKTIYPNREEMVLKNIAAEKEKQEDLKNIVESSLKEVEDEWNKTNSEWENCNIEYDMDKNVIKSWWQDLEIHKIVSKDEMYLDWTFLKLSVKEWIWLANFKNRLKSKYWKKRVQYTRLFKDVKTSLEKTFYVDENMLITRKELERIIPACEDSGVMKRIRDWLNYND